MFGHLAGRERALAGSDASLERHERDLRAPLLLLAS